MRSLSILAAALVAAAPLAAQAPAKEKDKAAPQAAHGNHDPDHAAQGGVAEGWSARLDRGGPVTGLSVAPMGGGVHVTTGPHAIVWRGTDRVNGPFHAVATFNRTRAPRHPESYGMFFGGKALEGEGQKYYYLLVRGDGKFLIKERNGAETRNVTSGWTARPAVHSAGEDGKVSDKLEIDATKEGTVRFLVNGQVVHEQPMSAADVNGVVGLRANHNLDLHVAGFEVHRM